MNKRPVSYLQTDKRWKNKPYRVKGENSTIGGSGCGPTAAAMLIETITGKTYTPEDACAWSVAHGYKALNQGTYYSYFTPQFAEFGIKCWQLSWDNTYHKPDDPIHDKAFQYLKDGYYLISLMKKGHWTSGGHFVVVWWEDGKVRINDPASTRESRLNGDIRTFRNECAYYWVIDARSYNNGTEEEDEEMTDEAFLEKFNKCMGDYVAERRDNDCSDWSNDARHWAVSSGLIQGGSTLPDDTPNYMWEDLLTREQAAQLLYRFARTMGKA